MSVLLQLQLPRKMILEPENGVHTYPRVSAVWTHVDTKGIQTSSTYRNNVESDFTTKSSSPTGGARKGLLSSGICDEHLEYVSSGIYDVSTRSG